MADLSVEDLEKAIKGILKGADLSNLSTKKVRKMLEAKFEADLVSRKKEIDKLVMKFITENEEEEGKDEKSEDEKEEEAEEANGVSDESDAMPEDEKVPKKKESKQSKPSKKKTPTKADNSEDKQQPKPSKRKSATKADDSEDPVMSSIKQMDDEDLAKRLQEEESGLRTRGARRAAAAPPKPKKRKEQDPDKKKKPSVYNRPCRLSDDLASIVGTNEMPRPEVVKTLWSIVKERNLQDPENKQFIICDDELFKVFGVKRMKAFGMMKYLKKHIINKEPE